jgi:hypothetical protein
MNFEALDKKIRQANTVENGERMENGSMPIIFGTNANE